MQDSPTHETPDAPSWATEPQTSRAKRLLSSLLLPASWIYGRAAMARRRWHTRKARRLERPVISVGNITCGGTGKTPAVEMILRDLLGLGLKPAVLSRGYGVQQTVAGADGRGVRGNDEFHVLRANLPGVPHVQDKDRYRGGHAAMAQGADVLVLDDGFQHTKLERDLDLVLIDAIRPFGHGRVLPAGLLREPLHALSVADLFAVSRSGQVEPRRLSTLTNYLRRRFPGKPVIHIDTRPLGWVSIGGEESPSGALAGRRVLAFCGIGNPESFRRQLLSLELDVRAFVCYRDHHSYTESDIERLASRARQLDAEEVVMTQKDAVKIELSETTARWKYLRIECQVTDGQEDLAAALESVTRA